jgi:hypothetical protein
MYRFYMDPICMLRMRNQPKEQNVEALSYEVNIVEI